MILLSLIASGLIAADAALSYSRMKRFGVEVELNPLAKVLAAKYGPFGGVAALVANNAAVMAVLLAIGNSDLMAVFVGAKLGLASLQAKSLYLEYRKEANAKS